MGYDKKNISFVLLGETGSGKSASGNTILDQKVFVSNKSPTRVAQEVTVKYGSIDGFPVAVYCTPGFCGTNLNDDQIREKCLSAFTKCESESFICMYLLVLKIDRFTEEERKTVQQIENLLGEDRIKNTWILFTGGDQLEEEKKTIEDFIHETDALKKLVQKFNNRYHVFNNKLEGISGQGKKLLQKVLKTWLNSVKHLQRIEEKDKEAFNLSRNSEELRIVLLGRTGAGKSATGNIILNKECFKSKFSMSSVTSKSTSDQAFVEGRKVSVIDTPGLFDTNVDANTVAEEIGRSIWLSSPGPHAFLIVLPVNMRYTEQEKETIQKIEMLFGEEVAKYTIILFTHGDLIEGADINELIKENRALNELIQQCGGGYHIFNNKNQTNREQVTELLKKIDGMVEQNGGSCYTNEMFQEADRERKEMEERAVREEEEQRQRKLKQTEEEIQKAKAETEAKVKQEYEEEIRKLQSQLQEVQAEKKTTTKVEVSPTFWKKYKKYFLIAVLACTGVGAVAGGVAAVAGVAVGAATSAAAAVTAAAGPVVGAAAGPVVGAAAGVVVNAAAGAAAGAGVGLVGVGIGGVCAYVESKITSESKEKKNK